MEAALLELEEEAEGTAWGGPCPNLTLTGSCGDGAGCLEEEEEEDERGGGGWEEEEWEEPILWEGGLCAKKESWSCPT